MNEAERESSTLIRVASLGKLSEWPSQSSLGNEEHVAPTLVQ
jgi:hypothetical protein